jgi:predicted MPP superfamily phosphohydrolase
MPAETLDPSQPDTSTSGSSPDSLFSTRKGFEHLHLTRRRLLTGTGLTLAGLFLYASEISRHELETVSTTLRIRNLPEAFHGFRIAQLSDIHLAEFTEEAFLTYAVHRINILKPDMVLLTGDYVSDGPRPIRYAINAAGRCGEILRRIESPLRYATLGNHDVNVGSSEVLEALRTHDIQTLVNQYVPIERDGQRLWLSGLDDAGRGTPDIERSVPAHLDAPLLMMCHEPDFADTIVRHPRGMLADVLFAGHTHGGQVRLPFLPPLALPPMGKLYPAGLFHLNRTQLYVNRGLGTVELPIRFNCPPEITLHTLQPA